MNKYFHAILWLTKLCLLLTADQNFGQIRNSAFSTERVAKNETQDHDNFTGHASQVLMIQNFYFTSTLLTNFLSNISNIKLKKQLK